MASGIFCKRLGNNFCFHLLFGIHALKQGVLVVLPFLGGLKSRGYTAILSFCIGEMPPMPMLGLSLSQVQSQGIPERGKFYHHGLLDCRPDSGRGGFMNFTSNGEEPLF
jgi:hypothetical protein